MENKKDSKLITLSLVLSILLLILITYILCDKIIFKARPNNESQVSTNNKKVIYDYSYGDYHSQVIEEFTINGKDISKYLPDWSQNRYYDKQDDFVIVTYQNEGTCGPDTYGLYIFDYDANLIYEAKDRENELDTLVYNFYRYSKEDKTLIIDYNMRCGSDCNICEKLFYEDPTDHSKGKATCNTINKFRNVNRYEKYQMKYLGNGKFSKEELIDSIKLRDGSYYKEIFDPCN